MQNMGTMMAVGQKDSQEREQVLRAEISTAVNSSAKDTAGLTVQVTHLTKRLSVLQEQLDTNANFSVDGMQQLRAEFRGEIEAAKLSSNAQAANAGGLMPGSATDMLALVNSLGKPVQRTSSDAHCKGAVPKVRLL